MAAAGVAVSLTRLAELRGAPAASGRQDGDDALAEARAPLLDAAPERRVRLAAVDVLHAVDLAAYAGALQHVAARCTHGPADHVCQTKAQGSFYATCCTEQLSEIKH